VDTVLGEKPEIWRHVVLLKINRLPRFVVTSPGADDEEIKSGSPATMEDDKAEPFRFQRRAGQIGAGELIDRFWHWIIRRRETIPLQLAPFVSVRSPGASSLGPCW
jgi:hypothetical protein